MNGDIKTGKRGMWIGLCCGFLILGLAACNLPGTGVDDPEPTLTDGASQEGEWGQQEQALKKVKCPEEWSMYELLYDHEAVLNSGDVGDVSFHFELEEEAPAYFYFAIEPSGNVTNIDITNTVTINVSGWHTTPSKGCPTNYIQGMWVLSADITGTCKKGVVTLNVKEHFESNELTGSCGDPISIPGGGPELKLTFNLSDPGSTDGLMSGSRGDPLSVLYWYQFNPSDFLFNTPQTPSP